MCLLTRETECRASAIQIVGVYLLKKLEDREERASNECEYEIKRKRDSRDLYELERFTDRPDPPLHLPRAPILRHNVSLCHCTLSPPYRALRVPAASPHAHTTRGSRSRACMGIPHWGILDFGNSTTRIGTAECRSRRPTIRRKETHTGGG